MGEGFREVVASAGGGDFWSASKLGGEDDEGGVEESLAVEVCEECGEGPVDDRDGGFHLFEVVIVPVVSAHFDIDVADAAFDEATGKEDSFGEVFSAVAFVDLFGFLGKVEGFEVLLGICFWREAPGAVVGPDRRAGKRGLTFVKIKGVFKLHIETIWTYEVTNESIQFEGNKQTKVVYMQNKFSEEELAKYSQEMGNAIAKAQELYSEYLEVLKNDDGQFTRDEKLLPASKETLRKAIIVVSIVSDDSPQVAVIADTLMRAWTALEFFGSPSKAPSEETLPLLFHRLESAGNSAAKEALNAYLEGYAKGTESSLAASTEWLQRVHASW